MPIGLGIGLNIPRRGGRPGGSSAPLLVLSASTIAEDASLTDVIGTLSVINLGILTVSSYAITADPDAKFDLSSANLIVDGALDYETATSHSVTVRATLSDASTVDRTFTITVTDVAEGGGSAGSPIGLLLTLTKAA